MKEQEAGSNREGQVVLVGKEEEETGEGPEEGTAVSSDWHSATKNTREVGMPAEEKETYAPAGQRVQAGEELGSMGKWRELQNVEVLTEGATGEEEPGVVRLLESRGGRRRPLPPSTHASHPPPVALNHR